MGKRIIRRIVDRIKNIAGRQKPPVARPVHQNGAHNVQTRFVLKQIRFQTKYFPELTEIHNRLLRKPEFHPGTKALKITGNLRLDRELTLNMQKMHQLEDEIDQLRLHARQERTIREMHRLIDEATNKEKQFTNLKKANFLILAELFGSE